MKFLPGCIQLPKTYSAKPTAYKI